jgi:DNA-binding GntR family transcriptional regulator
LVPNVHITLASEQENDKKNLGKLAYKSIFGLILDNHFKPGDFLLETQLTDAKGHPQFFK